MKLKRILLTVCLLLLSSSCAPRCSDDSCLRILFIGNSYTFVNDLPAVLTALAESGNHQIETGMVAEGGWTLADHANSADTSAKIASEKWDFVVLQEQSQLPSVQQVRTSQMYPAARTLATRVKNSGAQPIFFVTWAHRDGWPQNGMPTYESMQLQINRGYFDIANELGARMAPVGYAWAKTVAEHPEISLWQADGSHPSIQGTYLAACVFYATIFKESPEGLNEHANLSVDEAEILQEVAADVVLNNLDDWNIK